MKILNNLSISLRQIATFLGREGTKWLIISTFASFMLAFGEYAIAIFLQMFLVSINLMKIENLPAFLQKAPHVPIYLTTTFLITIGLARGFMTYLSTQGINIFSDLTNARLRLLTGFELLQKKNDGHFLSSAEVSVRYSEVFPKAANFIYTSMQALTSSVQLLFLFIGMLWIAPSETIVSLLGIILLGGVVKFCNSRLLMHAKVAPEEQLQIMKILERVSRNRLFITISGTQSREYHGLSQAIIRYFHHSIKARHYSTFSASIPPSLGIVVVAIIIQISQSTFHTSPSSLLSFLYLFIRFVQMLGTGVAQLGVCVSFFPQFRAAWQIFHSTPPQDLYQALAPITQRNIGKNTQTRTSIHGHQCNHDHQNPPTITLDNISFHWSNNDPWLFRNMSLLVKPGKILGINGPSGSGKSTLLSLILGIREPSHGCILIDEKTARSYLKESGNSIGYVGAEPFLIEGSIKDNLLYGHANPHFDDKTLWESLQEAGLSNDVLKLKDGLSTFINENGDGLSTGQKQRLAIARAFLRNPRLLILDEASANLDVTTELEIAGTIRRKADNCTIVIVSHRDGILSIADNLYTVSQPKIDS